MKTVTGLFARLCDPAHLEVALRLTVRGKRRRSNAAWLLYRRDAEVARLSAELASERWLPVGFKLLTIRDPKPRVIARAPIADRVVHTALVKCMEPALLRSLRPEVFACRPGFGAHRAVLRLLELVRRHRFFLHLDVRAYFPSIDREVLRELLARRIRDARFLAVLDRVFESGVGVYQNPALRRFAGLDPDWPPSGRGLPIGAYTSQVLGAWLYLDALDHHVKHTLKVPGYVRYVDDLFLFGRGRAELRGWREDIGTWLAQERGLRLKHPDARVRSCAGHLDGLGHRITRVGVAPLPRARRRLRARVAASLRGDQRVDIERSIASSVGILMF